MLLYSFLCVFDFMPIFCASIDAGIHNSWINLQYFAYNSYYGGMCLLWIKSMIVYKEIFCPALSILSNKYICFPKFVKFYEIHLSRINVEIFLEFQILIYIRIKTRKQLTHVSHYKMSIFTYILWYIPLPFINQIKLHILDFITSQFPI